MHKNIDFEKHFDVARAGPMAIVGIEMTPLLFRFFLHRMWRWCTFRAKFEFDGFHAGRRTDLYHKSWL
jgi:hypothetical protein